MRLSSILLLCTLSPPLNAAIFNGPVSLHPDHPNKCWLQEYSVFLIPGETYTRPGDCVEYRCESDFSYSAKTCGVVEVIDFNCGAVALDAQALYPKCCPQVVCD